jgi:polysaccharide export outer membrane protein
MSKRNLLIAALSVSMPMGPLVAQTVAADVKPDVVAPGDVLRIRIWREPDMSGDFSVNSSGRVVLPRLGELEVASISSDSLQRSLTDRYRVYLNNPSIDVLLLKRVTITGAVKNPGVYPLDPTLTISDALALAGGAAPDGKRDKVEIRRAGIVLAADLRENTLIANSPIRSGDQLYVPTKSWLSTNTWLVSGGFTIVAVVLSARLSRR